MTSNPIYAWVAHDARGHRVLYHPPCAWFCPPGRGGRFEVVDDPYTCVYCGQPGAAAREQEQQAKEEEHGRTR
jgi:hypothetical protein